MRLFLTTITLICLPFLAFAQAPDSVYVPFVSYWSVGDVYNFKIAKIEQHWEEGEQVKDEKAEYTARFEVIDSTETSYRIKWSYANDIFDTYELPANLLARFEKYENIDVIYKTTEIGEFVEVENWQEISQMMDQMYTDLVDVLVEEAGEKQAEVKAALETMLQPFRVASSSQLGIQQILLKELVYFHFPFGVEFLVGDKIEYEDLLPNVFGGAPIKANASLIVEKADIENDYCLLVQRLELDPKDTERMIKEVFQKMKMPMEEIEKATKESIFEVRDINRYAYYFYPGVPIKIETLRTTTIEIMGEKLKRIDKVLIELLD